MDISVKKWSVIQEEGKSKTVCGTYEVRGGGKVIATQSFNEGYSPTLIPIPAQLMADIEVIDDRVRQAIVDNFAK